MRLSQRGVVILIFLWVVARDQLLLPINCALLFTTEDFLITFFAGKKFHFHKFISLLLQVELRSSPQ